MKDYTLSEMRTHCLNILHSGLNCEHCKKYDRPLFDFCMNGLNDVPSDWKLKLEPRDLIELPCKIVVTCLSGFPCWQVVWRNRSGNGSIVTKDFDTEAEADKFLEELKGESK